MLAILSDVHANLEALLAVLSDIERHPVDAILGLGDLVNYGPDPVECVLLGMAWSLQLLGDHDQYVLRCREQPPSLPGPLLDIIRWTRSQLDQSARGRRCLEFLGELPSRHRDGGTLYVHGSPRDDTHEYLFPEDLYNQTKMRSVWDCFERLCFCGHTHIPGLFLEDNGDWQFISPEDCNDAYCLQGNKALVNVGSVGQSRDGDPRACYVLYDGTTVRFRRIDYDYQATARKIRDLPGLDDSFGQRLGHGR